MTLVSDQAYLAVIEHKLAQIEREAYGLRRIVRHYLAESTELEAPDTYPEEPQCDE
jgi:hypothetical protein